VTATASLSMTVSIEQQPAAAGVCQSNIAGWNINSDSEIETIMHRYLQTDNK